MKKPVFFSILLTIIIACDYTVVNMSSNEQKSGNMLLKSIAIVGDDIYISPSGDHSGVTDANNIEDALNQVKSNGGVVYLTDGDNSTVDNYYTSRNIVSAGFIGTLRGENQQNTIINAGRKSDNEGFAGEVSPWWSLTGSNSYIATILQFDNAEGDVIIRDLTIKVNDEQPTNIQPDYYGNDATYISTFIEILGGEHNTTIYNIRLLGKESNAFGNANGMNVRYGVHVMLGSPIEEISEKGNLSIKNIKVENIGMEAVMFMRFSKGSLINVEDVEIKNAGRGIYSGGLFGSSVIISSTDISIHPFGYHGIVLWNIPSGLKVTNNVIRKSGYFAIYLDNGINNATVTGNKFIDMMSKFNYAAILTKGSENTIRKNDFNESGLPGWTIDTPDGPGAIILTGSSKDNLIQFPQNFNRSLCEMILDLTDNQLSPEYDGLNNIHNFQPCEKLDGRDANFENLDITSGLFPR